MLIQPMKYISPLHTYGLTVYIDLKYTPSAVYMFLEYTHDLEIYIDLKYTHRPALFMDPKYTHQPAVLDMAHFATKTWSTIQTYAQLFR